MTSPKPQDLADHFEALFRDDTDPWQTRIRWYERRKRALTLAALPKERYGHAFEPGCGAGELTLALAQRCDHVVASDASAAAVRQARATLVSTVNVSLRQARMPDDWPAGRFDLILLSELGYYLREDELATLADACRVALIPGGALVACHWRRSAGDMLQSAQTVHERLQVATGLFPASHYEDDDFLLDTWTVEPGSIATHEGLA